MGYPDNRRPMLGVHGVAKVNGGSLPARIWHRYMSRAADVPCDYPVPDGFGVAVVQHRRGVRGGVAADAGPAVHADHGRRGGTGDAGRSRTPSRTSPPPTEPPQQQCRRR